MATLEVTCHKCDGDFELEALDLLEDTTAFVCPHCRAKLPKLIQEDLANAVGDLQDQFARFSKRFSVTLTVSTDDLPTEEEVDVSDDAEGEAEDVDEDDDLDEDEESDD